MVYLKKLVPAPIFLAFFATYLYLLGPLFNTDYIFITGVGSLQKILALMLILLLSSLSFIIFAALAADWIITLGLILVGSLLPFIFFPTQIGIILAIGFIFSAVISYLQLNQRLKTYITFQPTILLSPSVKQLAVFLIIIASISNYLVINKQIKEKGFEIPDSLIDTAIRLSTPQTEVKGVKYLAQVTPEQVEFLRQNPNLLEQQGIDPKILDQIQPKQNQQVRSPTPSITQELTKKLIKDQFNRLLEPYINYIPPILALIFFITLHSVLFLVSLFISPLLWLIFYILEKTNFVKFEREMREVKKLVV